MTYSFQDNEFTKTDILEYLTKAYRRQLNGNRFSIYNLNNWTRVGKIADIYGGHRILKVETVPIGKGIKIYTLEGLTRDVIKDVELLNIKPFDTKRKPKTSLPRKHRTKLYYEILKKAGKLPRHVTKTLEILPDNWREIGIKQNQLPRRIKKTVTA